MIDLTANQPCETECSNNIIISTNIEGLSMVYIRFISVGGGGVLFMANPYNYGQNEKNNMYGPLNI